MMNTVVGSAIGGLVAGAVALGAAAAMKPSPATAYAPDPAGAYAMTVANTAALNNPASLQCQPHEEAVLRRAVMNGREVTDVTCITRMNSAAVAYSQAASAQPVYSSQPQVVTRPVVRTVQQPARQRVVTREDVKRESDRSWGKTAMINRRLVRRRSRHRRADRRQERRADWCRNWRRRRDHLRVDEALSRH